MTKRLYKVMSLWSICRLDGTYITPWVVQIGSRNLHPTFVPPPPIFQSQSKFARKCGSQQHGRHMPMPSALCAHTFTETWGENVDPPTILILNSENVCRLIGPKFQQKQ
jgi:hypothetical protein